MAGVRGVYAGSWSARLTKQVVNDAIRRGLGAKPGGGALLPFRVEPHRTALRPGIDPRALNRLSNDTEFARFEGVPWMNSLA